MIRIVSRVIRPWCNKFRVLEKRLISFSLPSFNDDDGSDLKSTKKVKLYPGHQNSSEEIHQKLMLEKDPEKIEHIFGLSYS